MVLHFNSSSLCARGLPLDFPAPIVSVGFISLKISRELGMINPQRTAGASEQRWSLQCCISPIMHCCFAFGARKYINVYVAVIHKKRQMLTIKAAY